MAHSESNPASNVESHFESNPRPHTQSHPPFKEPRSGEPTSSEPAGSPESDGDLRGAIERSRLLPFLLIVAGIAVLLLLSLRYLSQISQDRVLTQQAQREEQQTSSTDAVAERQRRELSSLSEEQRREAAERAEMEEEVTTLLDQLRGRVASGEGATSERLPGSAAASRYEARRGAAGLTRASTGSRMERLDELRNAYYSAMQASPTEASWTGSTGEASAHDASVHDASSSDLSRIARAFAEPIEGAAGLSMSRTNHVQTGSARTASASSADLADRLLAQASGLAVPDGGDEWSNAPPSKRFARIEATTPYEVRAGTVIPCNLITEINSDQIGDISCQVYEDVYDQQGQHLLIPRGSRLLGRSESGLAFSASSLLALWHRLIFPDGRSLMLPGYNTVSRLGQTGLRGVTNRHWGRIIKAAVLVGIIGAGYSATQPTGGYYTYSPGQEAAASVARDINRVTNRIIDQSFTPPTIYIPAGIPVLVYVNTDLVLPSAYPREWELDERENRGAAGAAESSFDARSSAWMQRKP